MSSFEEEKGLRSMGEMLRWSCVFCQFTGDKKQTTIEVTNHWPILHPK